MGKIINGKEVARVHREQIRQYVTERKDKGLRVPTLASVIIGDDAGSRFYVNNQKKLSEELGMCYKEINLGSETTEEDIIKKIEELNQDNNIDGIILMLPLPKHLNEKLIISKISPKKDIDGLTEVNTGRLYMGEKCFIPCTPKGIIELVKSTGINIEGKNAVVVGRSNIVGKPIAQLLLRENATVTISHSKTNNLKDICKKADILVCAIGRSNFFTEEYVKDGAVIIDVGTSSLNGKITGDVCFDRVINKDVFITPVPGGVGAMTTTMLMKNLCEAVEK